MNSEIYTYVFYFIAIAAAVSALGVVVLRSIVHAAFALFFSLFSLAGIYVMLSADFIAAIQLIVYVGGILILILFGILFTTEIYKIEIKNKSVNTFIGLLISLPVLLIGAFIISSTKWKTQAVNFEPTAERIGNLLLGKYLFPFEVISVILLMIMLGAIVLVRKEIRGKR
jgi:NADH-quinone oxidoreductase subunit J